MYPDRLAIKKVIGFEAQSFDTIFFNDFFPCIEGHAKLLDEYFLDIRALFHETIVSKKIKFSNDDDDGINHIIVEPDWKVKAVLLAFDCQCDRSRCWSRKPLGPGTQWRKTPVCQFRPVHAKEPIQSILVCGSFDVLRQKLVVR
jgi:hypothetical protein